jgi:hypothetical protein
MRTQILSQLPNVDATAQGEQAPVYDVWVSTDGVVWGDYAYGCSYANLLAQLGYAEADASLQAVRVDRWTGSAGAPLSRLEFRAYR